MSPLAHFTCLVLAATVALPALGRDVVWVSRFDRALSEIGQDAWEVDGELAALHPVPGGDLLGLVASENGSLALVRWGPDGTEKGRWSIEARSPVAASRVLADGSIVVVADGELIRLSPVGQTIARRRLEYTDAGFEARVAASPAGAWVATGARVAFFGFDGGTVDVQLPPWETEEKPGEPRSLHLIVTETNECLVAQPRKREFEVERYAPPDATNFLVLAMVSARGEVLASQKLGSVRRSLEWFWKKFSGRDSLFPNIGFVRLRYGGGAVLSVAGERSDGGLLLLLLEDGTTRLVEVDRRLRERWAGAYGHDLPEAFSPPWATGLIGFTGAAVMMIGEQGSIGERHPIRGAEKFDISPEKGSAIGQTTTGEWLVIVWGTRAEENSR